jgi:hypothetical protein
MLLVINAAKQTRVDDETYKKREELQSRIEYPGVKKFYFFNQQYE